MNTNTNSTNSTDTNASAAPIEPTDAPCRGSESGCSCGAPGCVDYVDYSRVSSSAALDLDTATNRIIGGILELTAAETARWGALCEQGVEAEDGGEFRRSVIRELRDYVDADAERSVEVYAALELGGWVLTVVEP